MPTSVSTCDSFLFSWFMQIDSLTSSWYFYFQVTHWIPTNPHFHLSLTTFHFFSECSSSLAVSLWFPGYSTADPYPRAEELKAFISSWLGYKCFSRNLTMVFRDSLCYTAQLMLLFLQFMVSVFQLLIQGELGDC